MWDFNVKRLKSSRLLRGVVYLAGGTAIGQLLSVAFTPVITRLYTPDELGSLSVFVSVLSVLAVIGTLRYELAIPLPQEDVKAGELVVISLLASVLVSTVVALGVWGLGGVFASWINSPSLQNYFWLIPVGLLASGVHQALLYWSIRQRAYRLLAQTRISRSAATLLVQGGLGFAGLGSIGLILGEVVGRASGTVSLARFAGKTIPGFRRPPAMASLVRTAREYYRFPLLSSGSALLNAGGLYAPPILLAIEYGPHVAGLFALAQRVMDAPTRMVGTAVADVYMGEAAKLSRSHPREFRELFFVTLQRLLVVCAVPITLMGVAGPYVFGIVFGEDWVEAGRYVQFLTLFVAARFVVIPLSQTLNILNRQDLQLIWDAGRLLVVIATMVGGARFGLRPGLTIILFSGSMFLAYAVLLVTAAREVVKHSRRAPVPVSA